MFLYIVLIVCGFFSLLTLLLIFVKGRIIITEGNRCILETNGKYTKTLTPGQHFIIPFIQKTKRVYWSRTEEQKNDKGKYVIKKTVFNESMIPITVQEHDLCDVEATTKDNIEIGVNGILFYKIVDVKRAVYDINDLYQAMEKIIEVGIREQTKKSSIDEVYLDLKDYSQKIYNKLGAYEKDWGVEITYFEIESISVPEEIKNVTLSNIVIDRESKAKMKTANIEKELELIRMENQYYIKEMEREEELKQKSHLYDLQESENKIKELQKKHEQNMRYIDYETKRKKSEIENGLTISHYRQLFDSEHIPIEYLMKIEETKQFNYLCSSGNPVYLSNGNMFNPFNRLYYDPIKKDD